MSQDLIKLCKKYEVYKNALEHSNVFNQISILQQKQCMKSILHFTSISKGKIIFEKISRTHYKM